MTEAHKELAMENEAVALLHSKGWLYEEGSNARYDRKRALFPEDVFAWLEATQSDELAKFLCDVSRDRGRFCLGTSLTVGCLITSWTVGSGWGRASRGGSWACRRSRLCALGRR